MQHQQKPLRLGVVGCGAVTERYHLPALLASTDVEVVACVDATVERAQTVAARVGTADAFADHRDLIGRVDLALVAVPNAFHATVAVDLLEAGVHVLVEKPMARTVKECDEMLAAAAGSGAVLAVGHDFRHYPVARFARSLLAGGLLGRVLNVDVAQGAGSGWPAVSTAILAPAAGGGVLIDFGVHIVDLLRWWLGEMTVLSFRDDALGGVEAECTAEFELRTGAPIRLELSRTRTLRDTTVVTCERGTVELGVFDPAVVRLRLAEGSPALIGKIQDEAFDRLPVREVFLRQLADVTAAIRDGRKPLVGGWDGREAVALVEACYTRRQPLRLPWDYPEVYASHPKGGHEESRDLAGVSVLVIGASGFLGGRLVERLVLEHGARVRVLVRRVMGAASLARLPIEVVVGDILDPAVVRGAADGCAVIFNCAKGKGSDPALRRAVEVEGVKHAVRAAASTGARMVQVSTMAVYDLHRDGPVDETSAESPRGDLYADTKLEGERSALELGARLGVPVVVLQPSVVYGPNAGVHGTEIFNELTTSRVALVNGGTGICNAVYVDDVVTALMLGATAEHAPGERFLITGPEHPTWAQFFSAFEHMLGVQRTVPLSEAEALALWRDSQRRPWLVPEVIRTFADDRAFRARLLGTHEGALARQVVRRVRERRSAGTSAVVARTSEVAVSDTELQLQAPRPWLVRYLASKALVSSEKARALLGYEPVFGLAEGMRLTEQWGRWIGIIA